MNSKFQSSASKVIMVVQTLVSFALILAICAFSFGTTFTVAFAEDNEIQHSVNEVIDKLAEKADMDFEIRDEISVDFAFLMESASSIGDIVSAVKQAADDAKDCEFDNLKEDGNKLLEKLGDQRFVDFLTLIVLVFLSFGNSILLGIGNCIMLFLAIALPLICAVTAIIAAIKLLFNLKDFGNAFHKVMKSFFNIISIIPLILVVLLLVPQVRIGESVYMIMACCGIGVVMNFVCSRLKHYEGQDLRYINLMQIVCGISLVGYILFFLNAMNSGIIGASVKVFSGEAWKTFLAAVAGETEFDYLPMVMTLVLIVAMLSCIDNLTRIVTRLACMYHRKSDVSIVSALVCVLVVGLSYALLHMDLGFEIAQENQASFNNTCIGAIVMAVAEIVLAILIPALCRQVSYERRIHIVTGAYTFEVPTVASAPLIVTASTTAPVVTMPIAPAPVMPAVEEVIAPDETDPAQEAAADSSAEETV